MTGRIAVLLVACCVLLARDAFAQDALYRIGTVAGQIESASQETFKPFTDYLTQRIPGARFQMVPLPTIEALLAAADAQRLEFAFSTPVAFVELNARHRLRPIATVTQMVGEQTYPWLASAVFVRQSRRDIQQLSDIRGKQVIALSPLALGGWLAAVREWRALGIDEQRDFGSVRFNFSYAKLAAEVCAGTADVGVLSAATLRDVSGQCAEGFRVLPGPAGSRAPRYPTDVSSQLYPEAAFAVVGDRVDEGLITKVALELLSIEPGSAVATAAAVAGFTAPLSYTPVQQLMEELRIGPYESYGRLTFAQAIEQHSGKVLLVLLAFLSVLTFAFVRTRKLNTDLALSLADLKRGEEERGKLEAQLHHSQRMDSIGRLAGAVAHDFNNLLTVINGYSEMSLRGEHDPGTVRHNLDQINKAGHRAAELTHQLLTFSKKQISRPVALDLNEVVRDSETMFRRLLGEEIQLNATLHPSPCRAMADPGQMNQVLMNLVVNGRDAMPAGGTLTITTDNVNVAGQMDDVPPGAYVTLAVTDTGVGIDEQTRPHIFEPFFSTKGAAGTGLGLSTVYGIVRQSHGGVAVSTTPGAGTTFTIFLPRTDQEGEAPVARAIPVATRPAASSTILVVEDQDEVRGFATAVLEMSSYQVLEAASGEDALAIGRAHKKPIDLLVTDVVLRGMNGRELSEQFRLIHPETRVLFTSGYTDDEVARRGVQQGSIPFLPKPYSPEGLRERVIDVLWGGVRS
jgi:signal transduction histidine kinase/CheY-like chemotaxis protein